MLEPLGSPYEPANLAEQTALQDRWQRGELRAHLPAILRFVDRHHEELAALPSGVEFPSTVLRTIKHLIVQEGGVDPRAELLDQIRQIQAEIWIQGERGPHDPAQIAEQWAAGMPAIRWRRWRLVELLWVVDKCAPAIINRCAGTLPAP